MARIWRSRWRGGGVRGVSALLGLTCMLLASAAQPSPVHPHALRYDRLPGTPSLDAQVELHCLALNVFHEARGEPLLGMLAVAAVTLNRVRSPAFPNTICRVVWQRGQFSWTADGRNDRPWEHAAWRDALAIALWAQSHPGEIRALTGLAEATHFHALHVRPRWAARLDRVTQLGGHVFYRRLTSPIRGSPAARLAGTGG